MKRIFYKIHQFVSNPFAELAVGILIAISVLWLLVSQWNEPEFHKGGKLSLGFLGIFLIVRAIALLFESITLVEEAAEKLPGKYKRGFILRLEQVVKSPWFEFTAAIFLLAAGIIEGVEAFRSATIHSESAWLFGVILLGSSLTIKSLTGLLEALKLAKDAEKKSGHRFQLIEKLSRFFSQPSVEVFVGSSIIMLSIWELVETDKLALSNHKLKTTWWILIYGIIHSLRYISAIFTGAEFIGDTGEKDSAV